MSTSPAVTVTGLSKHFGTTPALDGVSLTIQSGELFGVLGPDGAGKTTLFRVLTTLIVPDEGRATVLGRDVVKDMWELRKRIGYMPGRFALYGDLTVEENLRFFARAFGTTIEEQYETIAPIYSQIEPFKTRRASALSGGMKQKLALSCALVHRPEILVLDEPTTGVDAVSRRELWDLLADLKRGGLTIVVSTPYMDEADRCDRVALMQNGRLLAVDSPNAIVEDYPLPLLAVRGPRRYQALLALRKSSAAHSVFPFGDSVHYTDARGGMDPTAIADELRAYLAELGFNDLEIETIPAGIEDSFMHLMGVPT